jgi:lipoprotein-releasing system ATP-binding protein
VNTLLKIDQIQKTFGTPGTHAERRVLSGISLSVERGETIAITGPSGSGKTTLLNLIAALDRPDSGKINFNGRDLSGLSPEELDQYRNRSIGLVFQLHHLLPQCTLLENVLIPTLAGKNQKNSAYFMTRAEALIRRMGLWEMRNQFPGQLSGGECQRTAVARALINDPELLLADEPTGALDNTNALNLIDLLMEINKTDGKTIIMVTHSPELAARMGRVAEISDGKFITS